MDAALQAEPLVNGAKYLRRSSEPAVQRDRSRRVRIHVENATNAIAQLQRLSQAEPVTHHVLREGDAESEVEDREAWRVEALELLTTMRETCSTLEAGPSLDMVRALRETAPHLLVRLRGLIPAALERATDLRATLSFLAGEGDHRALGLEAVPQPSRRRGPAVRARDFLG